MNEPLLPDDEGGDPPCWAAQFADDEDDGEGEPDEPPDPEG